MNCDQIILTGRIVELRPLELDHAPRFAQIGSREEVWRYMTARLDTEDAMRSFIETALEWQRQNTCVPFATVEKSSGAVVGSTRFANIVWEHKRAEIGWTWIAPEWQRTAVNTEAKYLMLRHAFETWNLNRVELKTNGKNEKSRRAIARIGGIEEGTLRSHMLNPDGTTRDTVYFSILREEWPEVKRRLEHRLSE